jgi:hypothetical protein
MILFDDIVEAFDLANLDASLGFGIVASSAASHAERRDCGGKRARIGRPTLRQDSIFRHERGIVFGRQKCRGKRPPQ